MTLETLPIRLSDASGVPYYRQIVEQVSLLIRSGELPPSSRLPSFRDLAGQLVVSLITVRRSYSDLEAAGLIVRRQGQGTFVADQVERASKAQSRKECRAGFDEAVARARQLGLTAPEIREVFESSLATTGENDDQT